MSAIKSKVKISNILTYKIDQWEETGDNILFSDVYKIKGLLGIGGFGLVLAVQNKETEEHSALKIWMKSSHALVINEEAKVLSSFVHPNIIKFKKMYETKSRFLMEIEFCKGGHLKKLISKREDGKFTEDEVLTIMRKLINAISYIHSKDYIHRDIKPENILFADKNDLSSLKIADFGLSTICPSVITETINDKVGTLLFMAPEQTDFSSYGK